MNDEDDDAGRVEAATEATAEMATYFLRALRDQEFRAHRFEQRLRWARMRRALTSDEPVAEIVEDDQPLADVVDLRVTPSVVLPEPRQPAGT